MITIVNYGMGNLGSIVNLLKKIGMDSRVSSELSDIQNASKLILPGVGAFDKGMENLHSLGLVEPIRNSVLAFGTPILGICLGMQLLAESSEEGVLPGLGLIPGVVKKFNFASIAHFSSLRIPHMGWNSIRLNKKDTFFSGLENSRFYFVHSFYMLCKNDDHSAAKTTYGIEFTAAVQKENILGAQFHPEKSHQHGIKLFKKFVAM